MKRLLYYFNQITDSNTTTFRYTVTEDGFPVQKEIYDGECGVIHLKPNGKPASEHTGVRREPVFWEDDVSFILERTSRTALDRPTVTIAIPSDSLKISDYTPAAADFCLRQIKPYFDIINSEYQNKARPDSDNGKFIIYEPQSEILIRNSAYFKLCPVKDYTNGRGAMIYDYPFAKPEPDIMCLCIRMEIQLPHGKLKRAKKMLCSDLPDLTERFITELNHTLLHETLMLERKQNEIRRFLREESYCAFIANGSILARENGTNKPMKNALPFISTPEDLITIAGVSGMGIKRGVTVITGGGYSGKSTVLNAISAGIYNHIMGDGRELCITDDTAVTITAEDGRAVSSLNISPFIKWIPNGDAFDFSTAHASGSTSQAANIMEAIDCGSKLLLIDEDRSATNFMIRDAAMKELIKKKPIMPFTDRVRELNQNGISTILVIGGSSEYLAVADKVYLMDDFIISDTTVLAQPLAPITSEPPPSAEWRVNRILHSDNFSSYPMGMGSERLEISDTGFIIIGDERIDIRALHDITTPAQINTLAFMLRYLERNADENDELEILALAMRGLTKNSYNHEIDTENRIRELYSKINSEGFNFIDTGYFTAMSRFMDLPRENELKMVINRMRCVTWSLQVL